MRPVVLAVGGSDPTGGAGIQGDVKTIEAHGCHAATALTSITVQTLGAFERRADLDAALLRDQLRAVFATFDVRAVKTGMLGTAEIVRLVAGAARENTAPLVVDPVLRSATGGSLLDEAALGALRAELLPRASLVTPNRIEAERLSGVEIRSIDDARKAAELILATGAAAVLIKSASEDAETLTDLLARGNETRMIQQPRRIGEAHGTGCALASSAASGLALGETLDEAVDRAVAFVRDARHSAWAPARAAQGILGHHAGLERDASRHLALRAVEELASLAEREDWTRVLPEVGSNIVILVAHARDTRDVATLAGRLVPVLGRLRQTGGATFRPTSHMARFLLAIHHHDASIGAAMNTRYDDEMERAFRRIGWQVAYFDRTREPADAKKREGGTMPWGASEAMRGRARAPDVVVDLGELGKEKLAKILAVDANGLALKMRALVAGLEEADAKRET